MSRPPGRGSALTPDERREIQRLSIVEGRSIGDIARRTDRDRGTVAAVLKSGDSQTLCQQFESDSREEVQRLLRVSAPQAARDWSRASAQASEKGDHRPARDLLLHSRAIDPVPETESGGSRIAIIIGTDEHPMRLASPLTIKREDDGHGPA